MKYWRSDDWTNPYHKTGDFGRGKESWNEQPEFSVYEAGADAMLEALFKMAKESSTGTFVIDSREITVYWGKGGK